MSNFHHGWMVSVNGHPAPLTPTSQIITRSNSCAGFNPTCLPSIKLGIKESNGQTVSQPNCHLGKVNLNLDCWLTLRQKILLQMLEKD